MSVHFYTVQTSTTYADDEFFTIPPQHCFSAEDRGSEYLYLLYSLVLCDELCMVCIFCIDDNN